MRANAGRKVMRLRLAYSVDLYVRRFLAFREDIDVLLSPMAAVPPFPVEQLYPTHIDGEELRSYFHWPGLSHGITLTAHPPATERAARRLGPRSSGF